MPTPAATSSPLLFPSRQVKSFYLNDFGPLPEGAPGRVVLDLSGVGFIDSSGLGAVVAVRRFLREGQALDLARLGLPAAG